MLETVGIVDMGKSRNRNDDRILINTLVWSEEKVRVFLDGDTNLLAVADGVGGGPGGDRAAEITLEAISELAGKKPSAEAIWAAILCANRNVQAYGEENPSASGLAATLSGTVVEAGEITTFNLGDSRVYRYRQGALFLLTKDHSAIQPLIDMGALTQEEAQSHKDKSIITRYVGSDEKCVPDIVENVSFEEGDIILVCSDGLTDYVDRDYISEVLSQNDISEAADELVRAANDAGGFDNISVLLAKKTGGQIYEHGRQRNSAN